MSKMTVLVIFCNFLALRTCLESKEKTSNFNKMFYSVFNFHREKFERVIFHLQSLKFNGKCKN